MFLSGISFYSTYEELKLYHKTTNNKYKESFYSTYEELKLVKMWCWIMTSGWFLQYLWGIETVAAYTGRNVYPHVFTVPMRNWNIYIARL